MKFHLLLFITILQLSLQRSTINSDTYNAVVIEYSPQDPTDPDNPPLSNNSEAYVSYIHRAGRLDADIIVFPEDGLTSVNLPDRERMDAWSTLIPLDYVPCGGTTIQVNEVLKAISCAAKDAKTYVVINIAEKLPCEDEHCPRDKKFYYNSQAVFDRDGRIIAKYRKTHLFAEPQFNVTSEPEIVTFNTDFGVTFGTFICFDILFKEPSLTLTRVLNVTDFVYSTAWFSEVPFLTAIQTQAGWSFAEDVNLLAAGYNRLKFGNAGSGIYLGRNGIGKVVEPAPGDMFIMYKVLKKNRNLLTVGENIRKLEEKTEYDNYVSVHDELRKKREADVFHLFHDDMALYKAISLNSSLKDRLCDGEFCCDFDVEMANIDSTSVYKLVTFNGVRTFTAEPITVGIQSCAVVQCANDSITSCGVRLNSPTIFTSIRINATFLDRENIIIFPSSVDATLLPLSNWTYKETFVEDKLLIEASLDVPAKDVITCGLYARNFKRDVLRSIRHSTVGMQLATITALVIISVFFLYLYRKGWRLPLRRHDQVEMGQYNLIKSK